MQGRCPLSGNVALGADADLALVVDEAMLAKVAALKRGKTIKQVSAFTML